MLLCGIIGITEGSFSLLPSFILACGPRCSYSCPHTAGFSLVLFVTLLVGIRLLSAPRYAVTDTGLVGGSFSFLEGDMSVD